MQVEMKFLELHFHAFHISPHILKCLAEIPVYYIQGLLLIYHICFIQKRTKKEGCPGMGLANHMGSTTQGWAGPVPSLSWTLIYSFYLRLH